jgi:hypothetical protein
MSRERLARLALSAHPPGADTARREEMLGTLLDASAGSRPRFAREVVDLVRVGLRARALQAASAGAGRLIADGLRLAAVWLLTVDLVTLLSWRYRGMHGPLLGWPSIALLAVVLALALVGVDRLAGAGALVWTALRLPALLHYHPGLAGLAAEVLPAVCFAAMVLAPRRRGPDLSGLAWLVVPVALVATCAPPNDERNPLLLAMVVAALLLFVVFALAMLPTDPRLAIAGAVGLSDLAVAVVGINHDTSVVACAFLAAAPAALAFAVARTRQLRRQEAVNRYVV